MLLTRLRPARKGPVPPRSARRRPVRVGPARWLKTGALPAGWRHVRAWRRSRPFWGGTCTVLAGVELLSIPFSSRALFVAVHSPGAGIAYLLSITMILLGVVIWLQPAQRVFLGVMAVLISAASVVYANMGGFLLGAFLGLLGGATTAAWTPGPGRTAAGTATGDRTDEPAGRSVGKRVDEHAGKRVDGHEGERTGEDAVRTR